MSRSPVAPVLRPATHGTASATPEKSADLPTPTPGTQAGPRPAADTDDGGRAPGAEAEAGATPKACAPADARPEARTDAETADDRPAPSAEADAETGTPARTPALADARPQARADAEAGTADDGPAPGAEAEAGATPKACAPADARPEARTDAGTDHDGPAPGAKAEAGATPKAGAPADARSETGAEAGTENDGQAPPTEADARSSAQGHADADAAPKAGVPAEARSQAHVGVDDDRPAPGAQSDAHAQRNAETDATPEAGAPAGTRPKARTDAGTDDDGPASHAKADVPADARPQARADADSPADGDSPAPPTEADAPADVRPQALAGAGVGGGDGGTAAEAEDEGEVGSEPRLRGALRTAAIVCGLALALTAGGIVVGAGTDGGSTRTSATRTVDTPVMGLASADLNTAISGLQTHLRAQPKDGASWATLGAAYVEQARTSGDPTRYPQAEEAFKRSMTIQPRDNDSALAGRAALAAARHDFDSALRYADRALAVNPYSERALAVRIDALVELGRYDDAYTAAEHADSLRPGIPVFTRLAYVKELRGDPAGARKVLLLALDQASSTGDIAYVATAIGHLAWEQGDYTEALKRYGDALRASPDYIPALEGRGRTLAARGDMRGALSDLSEVVQRYPLPAELAALGEVYEVMGQDAKARQHYSVVGTWIALARANGVATDLDTALVAADHGDPAEALRAARAEWDRRHSVHTADAMAWALHVNGQDKEALGYAKQALAPGYRNALFLYHRGMIERALGDRAAARKSLTDAMELNPGFSPTGAKAARAALKDLGGAEAGR